MRFLGRSLSSAETLDAPVAGRLRELWEARVQAVRNGADATELTAFGEWFGAGKLGDEWELQQLITALNLAGRIESEHDALPRLAALAPAHTSTCLTALEAWVRLPPQLDTAASGEGHPRDRRGRSGQRRCRKCRNRHHYRQPLHHSRHRPAQGPHRRSVTREAL